MLKFTLGSPQRNCLLELHSTHQSLQSLHACHVVSGHTVPSTTAYQRFLTNEQSTGNTQMQQLNILLLQQWVPLWSEGNYYSSQYHALKNLIYTTNTRQLSTAVYSHYFFKMKNVDLQKDHFNHQLSRFTLKTEILSWLQDDGSRGSL